MNPFMSVKRLNVAVDISVETNVAANILGFLYSIGIILMTTT